MHKFANVGIHDYILQKIIPIVSETKKHFLVFFGVHIYSVLLYFTFPLLRLLYGILEAELFNIVEHADS